MVTKQYVDQQLKRINFRRRFWGQAELDELVNILMPDEEICECVSGSYEGGFALLVVTDERLLLIDKKPFQFLTVEDMRFSRINQIDYSYRLIGAYINVNAGLKNLKFTSLNKTRLRKLVNHIQMFITQIRQVQSIQSEKQQQHLEDINEHLKLYLERQKNDDIISQPISVNTLPVKPSYVKNDNLSGLTNINNEETLLQLGRNELLLKQDNQFALPSVFDDSNKVSHIYTDTKKMPVILGKLIINSRFVNN